MEMYEELSRCFTRPPPILAPPPPPPNQRSSLKEMDSFSQEQLSQFFIVVKEIMALHRERRELLASLTPGVSIWRRRGGDPVVIWVAGKDYTATPVQVPEVDAEPASTVEQLGRYFDSILQDMEDLSHRMLSMAHGASALSSYQAGELVDSTSGIMDACKELYKYTEDNEQVEVEVEEVQRNAFLTCYRDILRRPWNYEHAVGLAGTMQEEEDEDYEKEVEKEKKRAEEVKKETERKKYEEEEKKGKGKEIEFMHQKDKGKEKEKKEMKKVGPDPATMEYLKAGMHIMEKFFADNRRGWNRVLIRKSLRCGSFRQQTTLSPMHLTHYTADTISSSCGVTGSTLQIYSFKILELKNGLKWPLKLYGVVAARDSVDHNRNIIFSRSRLNYQDLCENGSLCLTGPARAIVALDSVDFEVELGIIKEGEEYQGQGLITLRKWYDGRGTSLLFENSLCKAVLKLGQLSDAVQATIVGVCVVEGKWPFEYGCRVVCCETGNPDGVVLKDVRREVYGEEVHGEEPVGSNGYLHLSRNVVSVQSSGTLRVVIQSYTRYGRVGNVWNNNFPAKQCQTSESECSVGTWKVKVVVAWSLLVKEKRDLMFVCPAVEP